MRSITSIIELCCSHYSSSSVFAGFYQKTKKQNQMNLTDKQRGVYDQFKKHGRSRPDFIAKEMGFTESAYIYGSIKALVKKGFLQRCDGQGLKFVHYEIIK